MKTSASREKYLKCSEEFSFLFFMFYFPSFLKTFLLIICEFPSMPLYPSHLLKLPQNEKTNLTMVCHELYIPFAQRAFHANVHCNESLVQSEVSGFCSTINTGSSPGLLSGILLLSCVMEILQLWFCNTSPFTCSSSS